MLSQVCIHILVTGAEKRRGWIIEHRWSNINPYLCHINQMLAILCHSCHYYNHSSPLSLGNQSCQVRMTGHWAVSPCPAEAGLWSLVLSRPRINIRGRAPGLDWGCGTGARQRISTPHPPTHLPSTSKPPIHASSLHLQTSIPPAAKTIQSRCGLLKNRHTKAEWVWFLKISFNRLQYDF